MGGKEEEEMNWLKQQLAQEKPDFVAWPDFKLEFSEAENK